MTAASILALCVARGVRLEAHGDGFRVHGPKEARAELKPLVLDHKAEVLAALKSPGLPGTTTSNTNTTTTLPRPLSPAGFGYDWRGRLVDLRGLRPGEDGRPPVFMAPKPEGVQ